MQDTMAKHVEVIRYFIEEKLKEIIFSIPFVRIEDPLAGILTKVVELKAFKDVLRKLDVGDPTIKKLEVCYSTILINRRTCHTTERLKNRLSKRHLSRCCEQWLEESYHCWRW